MIGKELATIVSVAFLCYKETMDNKRTELDEDIFKEVCNILKQEQEKTYWRSIKSLNKKKNLRRKKKIANVLR